MENSNGLFTQECHREAFKGLCINVLPLIEEISRKVKKSGVESSVWISIGEDGYLSFEIHQSRWKMKRMSAERPARIEYEYSEELVKPEVLNGGKAVFGHLTENIMEISMMFAHLQARNEKISEIDSTEWKQLFVDWANEFEEQWKDEAGRDYLTEIEEFAEKKILEKLREVEA